MIPWPSELVRRALSRLLGDRVDALGDLEEELGRRRAAGRGPLATEWWYLREGLSLAWSAILWTGGDGMRGWVLEARWAARGMVRRPGGSVALALTVAMAVGATSTVYALVHATFLRALPYPDEDRLVRVFGAYGDPPGRTALAPLGWRQLGEQPEVISDVGVWSIGETVHLLGEGEPRRLNAPRASAGLFEVTGLPPARGRLLDEGDEVPGQDDVVVLSHAFWRESFGGDPAAVGRRVLLDGRSYEVVGVADPGFDLPREADLWRPLALEPVWFTPERRGWEFLDAVARLRVGVTPETAARILSAEFARREPDRAERLGQGMLAAPLRAERVAGTGPALTALMVAVSLILLMACVNVTTVLLARAEARSREHSLRRALGSGSRPLVRGAFLEAGLLAVVGGSAGLVVATLAVRWVAGLGLDGIGAGGAPEVDPGVALFTAAVVGLAALLMGVAPALRSAKSPPGDALRRGGERGGGTRSGTRARAALVVLQVALALVLLVGVGTAAGRFMALVSGDPGFRPRGVLTFAVELPASVGERDERVAIHDAIVDRLAALPGVTAVGMTNALPLEGTVWSASFDLVEPDAGQEGVQPGANIRSVRPGTLEALGIPLLEGRALQAGDRSGGTRAVVVDRALARRYWGEASPLGRQVQTGVLGAEAATVVGVVGDVPDEALHLPSSGHLYLSALDRPLRRMRVVLRTSGDPATLAGPARAVMRDVDARVPVFEMATLEDRIADSTAGPRLGVVLFGFFGAMALVLAALGLYGVLAHSVSLRRREFGTRLALGADPSALVRSVVRDALVLCGLGVLAGGVAVVLMATGLERWLPSGSGVPVGWGLAAAFGLAATALVSSLVPSLRASRTNPAETLREGG